MDHDSHPRKKLDLRPTSEAQSSSCDPCTTLCKAIQIPVTPECQLRGCHICTDYARVNDEIASAYKRLFDLVAERQKIMTKTCHITFIHRMPVEILSLIFLFASEAEVGLDFDPKEVPEYDVDPERPFRQPSISPPLLGAVCRRWRDTSLAMPQLWTDLIICLTKPLEGQYNMVKEWARRSGALPVDIVIFPQYTDLSDENSSELSILLSTLRLLAPRWNDLALSVPATICHRLLDNLEDTPPINSLSLFNLDFGVETIKLPHPLRSRRLICNWDVFYKDVIPFEWHRLEFLKLHEASADEILYIIQHAPNLRHCIALAQYEARNGLLNHMHITHRNLISYNPAFDQMIQHLTLPALQHLHYGPMNDSIDCLAEFLDRSRAPLNVFSFRCFLFFWDSFPPLERLCGVTSLFLEIVEEMPNSLKIDNFLALLLSSPPKSLSRLKKITFQLPDLAASSWSILGDLFQNADPSNGTPVITSDYAPTRKAKSGASIPLSDDIIAAMKTGPILRLLEVKQSGVDIQFESFDENDLLIL